MKTTYDLLEEIVRNINTIENPNTSNKIKNDVKAETEKLINDLKVKLKE